MNRIAACACGALSLQLTGEPVTAYLCGCHTCRRTTGSAFGWRARYRAGSIVAVEGRPKRWRRVGDAGRWVEHVFCSVCGATVWMTGEGLGDDIAVSAGSLQGPEPAPSSAHRQGAVSSWLFLGPDVHVVS